MQIISLFCAAGIMGFGRPQSSTLRAFSSAWDAVEPSPAVKKILQTADIFCFDVDSTLIRSETIDELAEFLQVGSEVKRITSAAMGGSINFTEALRQRLDLMRPSEADIARFQERNPLVLSDGVRTASPNPIRDTKSI